MRKEHPNKYYAFSVICVFLLLTCNVSGQPIPPPRKDCIPGYTPCNLDYRTLQVGKIGAATFGFLSTFYAAEDVEKQALGQGTSGVSGTDNAENFNLANPNDAGPRVGRRLKWT